MAFVIFFEVLYEICFEKLEAAEPFEFYPRILNDIFLNFQLVRIMVVV